MEAKKATKRLSCVSMIGNKCLVRVLDTQNNYKFINYNTNN
jgi:hypothetical protein